MNISEELKQYVTIGKLSSPKIPCTTPDCTTETTCFGSNLANRIAKLKGGLEELLSTFKCRSCRAGSTTRTRPTLMTADLPAKRERVAKKVRTPRSESKSAKKQTAITEMKETLRSMTINVSGDIRQRINFKNEAEVRALTEGACQRPDIYLDNDRACDGCDLYEFCACSAKQLLAATGRKKAAAGPRRKK